MLKYFRSFIAMVFVFIISVFVILAGMRIFGFAPYIVTSGSMSPAFDVGSMIYVKSVLPDDIQVGDPITFRIEDTKEVVTHRVIRTDVMDQYFYTKGDANEAADGAPVSFDELIGKPVLCIPLLGYLSSYVMNPPGLYIFISVAALIAVLMLFPDLIKKVIGTEESNEEEQKSVNQDQG